MADPFLDIGQFGVEFGSMSDGQAASATRLLDVVSDYIILRKPDADETAAAQVVFEIVRDALNFGPYERLSQFDNETSKRKEAGTFNSAVALLDELLLPKHKRMLGIPLTAAARGSFTKCDY